MIVKIVVAAFVLSAVVWLAVGGWSLIVSMFGVDDDEVYFSPEELAEFAAASASAQI